MSSLTPLQENYLASETEKLNGEISALLEEIHKREKFSLTILGGITAWVLTEHFKKEQAHSGLLMFLSLIPILSSLFYGFSVYSFYKGIKIRGIYLKRIEKLILFNNGQTFDPKLFGWERFFDGEINNAEEKTMLSENHKTWDVNIAAILWGAQLLLGLILFFTFLCFYLCV